MSDTFVCPECKREYSDPELRTCVIDGSPIFRPESLQRIGIRLDKYELTGILGEGGMGVVYKGRHVLLDKPVAVKILHERYAKRHGAVKKFLHEAKAASRTRHPNIVDVTDFGQAPGNMVYLVMEYLEGISLDDVLARDRWIPLFNTVNIVRQAANALAAAHDEGIVHLDLKPENIFLTSREGRRRVVRRREGTAGKARFVVEKEGSYDFVKLVDFGVAKFLTGEMHKARSTEGGLVLGTPHYMSPEQARGLPVDGRSDIYSLGILFYEMITGYVPYDSPNAADILNDHVFTKVPPPQGRNPDVLVDTGTNDSILKCLEKDPDARYQTMDELLIALVDCFTDTVFLRDAQHMPGAVDAGIVVPSVPPPKKPTKKSALTEDLEDLFSPASLADRESGDPILLKPKDGK